MPFLEPGHDARGAARRRRHEEVVIRDAGGHAVVHDHAVLVEHQAVAALAGCELRPGVGVDAVQELAHVLAADVDLAERGGVHDADAAARGQAFAAHGGVHVLAALREIPRAQPLSDGLELGAARDVAGVHGRIAARLEGIALVCAGERAERDRRVGRAIGRGADLGDGLAERIGGDGKAVDVRELALIGAEAQRRIALDVLDRAIVLAHGEMNVGGRDVVLKIDEGLLSVALGLAVRDAKDAPRRDRVRLVGVHVGALQRRRLPSDASSSFVV